MAYHRVCVAKRQNHLLSGPDFGHLHDMVKSPFIVQPNPDTPGLSQPVEGVNESGALVTGLFLQGCKWDPEATTTCTGCAGWEPTGALDDSEPRVLFTNVPMIWIDVMPAKDLTKRNTFYAPLYKVSPIC